MSTPNPHNHEPNHGDRDLPELRARWIDRYGPLVATQLEPDHRYSLMTVGGAEYAFTDYVRYVRALRRVWISGLIPEPLGTVAGSDLVDVAPNLRAVDPDPEDLGGRIRRSRSRFT
jgi:hypothetical protein